MNKQIIPNSVPAYALPLCNLYLEYCQKLGITHSLLNPQYIYQDAGGEEKITIDCNAFIDAFQYMELPENTCLLLEGHWEFRKLNVISNIWNLLMNKIVVVRFIADDGGGCNREKFEYAAKTELLPIQKKQLDKLMEDLRHNFLCVHFGFYHTMMALYNDKRRKDYDRIKVVKKADADAWYNSLTQQQKDYILIHNHGEVKYDFDHFIGLREE